MSHLWLWGYTRLEVLKPQVDNSGYDLVLEANGVVRHVQLKTSHIGAATPAVNVHLTLGRKPSGCVIWTWFDSRSLALGPYWWFGSAAGEKLPPIKHFPVTKYTKANAEGIKLERHNLRRVPRAAFKERFHTIDDVVARLFGPLPYVEEPDDVEATLEEA